jgi:hypothetical protein
LGLASRSVYMCKMGKNILVTGGMGRAVENYAAKGDKSIAVTYGV